MPFLLCNPTEISIPISGFFASKNVIWERQTCELDPYLFYPSCARIRPCLARIVLPSLTHSLNQSLLIQVRRAPDSRQAARSGAWERGSLTASPQLALSCHAMPPLLALDIASKAHACSWPGARSVVGRSAALILCYSIPVAAGPLTRLPTLTTGRLEVGS